MVLYYRKLGERYIPLFALKNDRTVSYLYQIMIIGVKNESVLPYRDLFHYFSCCLICDSVRTLEVLWEYVIEERPLC